MTVIVCPALWQKLREHLARAYPYEGCGLLLGTAAETDTTVAEVWIAKNAWDATAAELFPEAATLGSARDRFAIDPRELLQAQKSGRDRGLDIVGVYHSHPDSEAVPSAFDREIAWAAYAYLIASVQQGRVAEVRCWRLDEATDAFRPEALCIRAAGVEE
ncbi:M67 family metallopeptidase [Rubidibacter lacunae]|uniref:M67 family metallopeptidase n=1 Tax=Rubidibacter lacunae TaxID=582514 RepID=UPI0022B4FA52|nr:M67 family metallopeptidase [Rubidibacter lacunae]